MEDIRLMNHPEEVSRVPLLRVKADRLTKNRLGRSNQADLPKVKARVMPQCNRSNQVDPRAKAKDH